MHNRFFTLQDEDHVEEEYLPMGKMQHARLLNLFKYLLDLEFHLMQLWNDKPFIMHHKT